MEESKAILNVLCLEDVIKDAEVMTENLIDAGYKVNVDIATGEKAYLSFLKSRKYDVILADYTLPGFNAPAALKLALKFQPEVPFICVSGTIGEDTAVELLKQGATDYVIKDRLGRLAFAVRRALEGVELQKELAIASEKYIELYDFAPSGYFTLSKKGEILQLNLLGAKMLGKDRKQLENSLFQLFISNDSKPLFQLSMEKAFGSNTLETCEVTLSVNGSLPMYVHLTGFVAKNGEQCYLTATDITEGKLAEESLVKLKTAIEKSEVSVVITDIKGNIEYANPFFTELTGYSADEYIGQNSKVLKSGYHPKEFYEELWNTINSGRTWEGEFYNHKKNGELYWENAIISPVENTDKEITHFVAIKTDITEAKKVNLELIMAKDHAEQSDRLKSAFLANMSHEIRTPMNGILGFANLLKEPNLTGEEQQEYIRIIEKSGIRMLNIINDIVDISKIEAGLMEVNLTESNINEQIEYIYTFFKPEVEGKGMEISYRNGLLSKESNIKTDREKLYAILTNLIKNAIKYTNKGSIEFGYDVVETHGRASLQCTAFLQFYVKDTGIGIPKDRQEAVFERFIQADISDKHAYQGAGLGLSISRAYVEMLGGKIWVESEVGKGSVFYFTIPVNTEPEERIVVENIVPADEAENKVDTKTSGLKILITEDDENSIRFIAVTVKKFSKEVLYASTGVEAVEVCRNNTDVDLVLMDIKMPVMNGYETTRQIRQFNKDVIIIAQTSYALVGDREKAIEAGCNDYITKPINKDKLLSLIQKYCKI